MPAPNPIDVLARNLAEWVISESQQIADSVKGGLAAPGAANLAEKDKLEYYTRQFFNPDGSPNMEGRAKEMARLGPVAFAETYQQVLQAHPEFRRSVEPIQTEPMPVGNYPIAPDGLPDTGAEGVPMPNGPIAPDGLPTSGRTG